MADRQITELTVASSINDNDSFVLQQNNEAKQLKGSSLKQYVNRNSAISSISQGETDANNKTHFIATFGGGQTFEYTLPAGQDIYLNGTPSVSYAKVQTLSDTPPTSGWESSLSALGTIKGYYVWTRYYIKYNTGQEEYHYDVAYQGLDGTGTVNSVNGQTGDVILYGTDIALSSSDSTSLSNKVGDLSQYVSGLTANKEVVFIAGVARYNGTTNQWYLLDDNGHNPMNINNIVTTNPGTFTIYHEVDATKVLSLVATPDETYAENGYTCGASVGVDYSIIKVGKMDYMYATITWNTNNTYTTTNNRITDVTIRTHASLGQYLHIEHDAINGILNLMDADGIHWVVLGYSSNYVNVQAYSNGTKLVFPLSKSSVFTIVRGPSYRALTTGESSPNGSNVWIFGILEK